jgi:hypothetical protein
VIFSRKRRRQSADAGVDVGIRQRHTRRKSRDAGFRHHLVKPFEVDSLRALLEDFLRDGSAQE